MKCTIGPSKFIATKLVRSGLKLFGCDFAVFLLEPINIFNGPNIINSNEPIRLSYHRMCHYNSISNPNNPSVGVGLGLPNYHTIDLDRRRFNDAVRASEELLIEQVLLIKILTIFHPSNTFSFCRQCWKIN